MAENKSESVQYKVVHDTVGAFTKGQVFTLEHLNEVHPGVDLARLLNIGAIVPVVNQETTQAKPGPEHRPQSGQVQPEKIVPKTQAAVVQPAAQPVKSVEEKK